MCTSRCGVVATVENGVLAQVNADPAHPNGCICVKGAAAPEIVYSPDRVCYPMIRTRPKGDANPGWVRITWDQALDLAALRLSDIKANYGAEAVVFSRATTAGSAASDFDGWLQRLANAFGSPNLLTSNHICTWNRRTGSKYTYGVTMPLPDFDHTRCMLLWGINPNATSLAQAARISRARNRGAKLIVIDPRQTTLAEKADCWLRVRPGTDAALALAMIHVLFEENLYDAGFARARTNGAFLVREDNQRLLTQRDLDGSGNPDAYVVWDERNASPVGYHPDRGYLMGGAEPALSGSCTIKLSGGGEVRCRPALELLKERAQEFSPERSAPITTVPAHEVRRAVRLFASEKPSCYCTWAGLEQDTQAMQTNRAVCCFYALTGQFDQRGSNMLFAATPTHAITGKELLSKEKAARRLGATTHPLGPPVDPGVVTSADVYDAVLTGRPYPVRAMVLFGTDPLLGHGDAMRGKAALEALDFYVHVDMIANPSANFADLLLPAATCWEREALMPSFEIAEDTLNWAQLRPAVVQPLHESRPDTEIIFDLAQRLGLSEQFFAGDIDAALNYQLLPSGLSVEQLRARPIGMRAHVQTRYRKYAEIDARTGAPHGFNTPTRKIEIYATRFADAGYAPLPEFNTQEKDDRYPLLLSFFRAVQFCDEQHRNIPRLRRQVPEPVLEINPSTAKAQDIEDGGWLVLETKLGQVRLKAKFKDSLDPGVVMTFYGWWQGCQELGSPAYNALNSDGANVNLIIANARIDPISASVPHRSQPCRVRKTIIS